MYNTEQYEEIVASITRRHVKDVWTVLSTHVGKENAISRHELVRQVQLLGNLRGRSPERTVRKCLEVLRDEGKLPIYSGREGYCIGLPFEMYEWALSYRAGAATKFRIAKKLMDVVAKMTGSGDVAKKARKASDEMQMTLDLEGRN